MVYGSTLSQHLIGIVHLRFALILFIACLSKNRNILCFRYCTISVQPSLTVLRHLSSITDTKKHRDCIIEELFAPLPSFSKHSQLKKKVLEDLEGTLYDFCRNFLYGRLASQSLLGAAELEHVFPDREVKIFVGTWNMNGQAAPRYHIKLSFRPIFY